MDTAIALALISAARYSIMTAFSFLEAAGKTETEIEAFYQSTKAEFDAKDPGNLADPDA